MITTGLCNWLSGQSRYCTAWQWSTVECRKKKTTIQDHATKYSR